MSRRRQTDLIPISSPRLGDPATVHFTSLIGRVSGWSTSYKNASSYHDDVHPYRPLVVLAQGVRIGHASRWSEGRTRCVRDQLMADQGPKNPLDHPPLPSTSEPRRNLPKPARSNLGKGSKQSPSPSPFGFGFGNPRLFFTH